MDFCYTASNAYDGAMNIIGLVDGLIAKLAELFEAKQQSQFGHGIASTVRPGQYL